MRKLAVILALALALALPTSALAATSTGTTTETIDNAATISMTVPATITYTLQSGTTWQSVSGLAISNLTSNNPTGYTVKATFSDFTGTPSGTISVSNRGAPFVSGGGGLGASSCNGFTAGGVTTTSQLWTFVNISVPTTNGICTFTPKVDNVGIATYSGSMNFTAATNP
jgi:hypothetical protein